MARTTTEEPKLKLPVGHPRAGYVEPDLSYHEGTGTLPDDEKAWHEERNKARDEDREAIAEAEHEAAQEDIEEREKLAEEMGKLTTKEQFAAKATGEEKPKSK